ncbi:MAG: membrane protein insertase YidC [Ruminococcus sp.]|nr:membrane protein insertase YidC [Ruminococcus sp.]
MNFLTNLIGIPFGYLMSWIYNFVGNYGLAIVIFTILTKLILLPVNYNTQLNSARMRLLNPKLEKLKKSYNNNPTKLQEEQQKLYQQEGLNPMASCMPSLIQMILLFGVLDVVYKPLTHIFHFGSKVKDSALSIANELLSAAGSKTVIDSGDMRYELQIMEQVGKDPSKFESLKEGFLEKVQEFSDNFTVLGANLGKTPSTDIDFGNSESVILFLIPILAGLSQLLMTIYTQVHQKKTNPNMQSMGCMNVMLYLMPVLSVWFAFQVPAGVGFYWICSSVFSFLITFGLNQYFTTERTEVLNEKAKEKAKKKAAKHPERKTFMQKMLEQQQLLEQQQNGSVPTKADGSKASRSEMNKYNRDRLNDARKRMAEKYGDEYDNNDED